MFEGNELEEELDENCYQTQEELADALEVTQVVIWKCWKAAGNIQK